MGDHERNTTFFCPLRKFMDCNDFLEFVASGEDSKRQFKANVRNVDSLVSKMEAFANSKGGKIGTGIVKHHPSYCTSHVMIT